MTAAYADSSALVKLYADEADADAVRCVDVLVVSQLARVEVPAALWRKQRMGELSAEDANVLARDFEADWYGDDEEDARFLVVAISPAMLDDAARLTATHGLRAYDAVQLASALAADVADTEPLPFLAFDEHLLAAAAVEGLDVVGSHAPDD
jgi:uncharacterized protein